MNAVGVQRLAHRGVVDVAVVLEVARQVLVRVLPAAGALDLDLAAAQRVPQRDQHAQLVGDALHPAVLVDDGVQPGLRHDAVDRDLLPGRVELLVAVGPRSGRAARARPSPAGRRCCCVHASISSSGSHSACTPLPLVSDHGKTIATTIRNRGYLNRRYTSLVTATCRIR